MVTIKIPNRQLNVTEGDLAMQKMFKELLQDLSPDQLVLMHSALTSRLHALGWLYESFEK